MPTLPLLLLLLWLAEAVFFVVTYRLMESAPAAIERAEGEVGR